MDKRTQSIIKRLNRIEAKALPRDGVGILELQPDGSWTLIEDGRVLGRYTDTDVECPVDRAFG